MIPVDSLLHIYEIRGKRESQWHKELSHSQSLWKDNDRPVKKFALYVPNTGVWSFNYLAFHFT